MRSLSRLSLGLAAASLTALLAACAGGSATAVPTETQAPAPTATARAAPVSPTVAARTPTTAATPTTGTPAAPATSTPGARSSPTSAASTTPATAATATVTPASTATTGPAALQQFFLEVTNPKNESVVKTASLSVTGRGVADAVVTVNGAVAAVGADGSFSATVTLDEGPNSIEVLASDFQGHSASNVISVIYTP